MPRSKATTSADTIILQAVDSIVSRTAAAISRAVGEILSRRLDEELKRQVARAAARGGRARGRGGARGRRRAEVTRWVADRGARRVPNFVIEQTGMKTKKQIVAKYGENAAFEKGKDKPKPK